MPEPTKTASAPSCITREASAGVAMPPAQNSGTGRRPVVAISWTQADGGRQLLGPPVELGRVGLGHLADVAQDRPEVAHGLDDVAGAGLALGADHGRPLRDPAQRLAEVGGAAHEGHLEVPLVDVVGLVGRGEDLALVDEVDPEGGQDLGLGEVADAGLGHDRDGHGGLDALDQRRVAHAGHAAVASDVGRDPLEGHDGHRTGVLGHLGLLGVDHVHDHAATQHLGQAALDGEGAGRTVGGGRVGHRPSVAAGTPGPCPVACRAMTPPGRGATVAARGIGRPRCAADERRVGCGSTPGDSGLEGGLDLEVDVDLLADDQATGLEGGVEGHAEVVTDDRRGGAEADPVQCRTGR